MRIEPAESNRPQVGDPVSLCVLQGLHGEGVIYVDRNEENTLFN